jgi:hypothetical protein
MIKKTLGLLFLPYLIFMLIEGCYNTPCDRKETRNITNLSMIHLKDSTRNSERMLLDMEYESYFVNNYRLDLMKKAYARSLAPDPCFEGFSNPIETVSIISANDFDTEHLTGTELNNLFGHEYSRKKLNNFDFNPFLGDNSYVSNQILIYNDSIPTLDSIHTLYFNIYCADGKTYLDTLTNVNLNRTNNWYYY